MANLILQTLVQEIIEDELIELKESGKQIHLTLRPPTWSNIIEKEDNRMYVNDGKDGEFDGVTEAFYDEMVRLFDSRA